MRVIVTDWKVRFKWLVFMKNMVFVESLMHVAR